MNIVNKLTVRHLKQNKRRTLVTIIGVIISVAMITAVATLGFSFMDLLQRQTIADEGEWHVIYKDIHIEQIEAIKNDSETKGVVLSRDLGFAVLEEGQNENKPYLFIKEYNTLGFEKFPIVLTKGRLPQATNEVVISKHIATNGKVEYNIGDVLELEVGDRALPDGGEMDYPMNQSYSLEIKNGEILETLVNTKPVNYTIVGL